MIFAFMKGALMGFSLVTPLGAQNAFIFNKATQHKRYSSTVPIVLTSALCDALLVLLAVLGVDYIFRVPCLKPTLLIVGICFLVSLGTSTWRSANRVSMGSNPVQIGLSKQILYTVSISLLNPHALLDTFVVIGSVSVKYIGFDKHAFVVGCILMDTVWFLTLAAFGFYLGRVRNNFSIIKTINRISAIIMFLVAVDMTVTLTRSYI